MARIARWAELGHRCLEGVLDRIVWWQSAVELGFGVRREVCAGVCGVGIEGRIGISFKGADVGGVAVADLLFGVSESESDVPAQEASSF